MKSFIKTKVRFVRNKGPAILLYGLSSVMLPPAACANAAFRPVASCISPARLSRNSSIHRHSANDWVAQGRHFAGLVEKAG